MPAVGRKGAAMFEWHVKGLSYQNTPILGDIRQSLNPGENHCIIGPSGSGKTTLLNMLAGLGEKSAQVEWLNNTPQIGYLFQQPRLLPWRTLRQNLMIVKEDALLVEEMLEAVKLQEYADYFPTQISLGMARRAALARCLLLEPDLILMDEPLVSLDTPTAEEMRRLIQKLVCQNPNRCLIYVTHDLDEALQMGDQVTVMGGKPAQVIFSSVTEGLNKEVLETQLRTLF